MFKNYLMVSFRNILKNRLFSAINIAGLSVGLSAVLLITLYIWDEFTYDSYLGGNPGIYKLELKTNFPGRGPRVTRVTGGAVSIGLKAEYPHLIKNSTRLMESTNTVTVGDRNVSETIWRSSATFFEIFNLAYNEGSSASALADMSSAAISQSTASKYFPGQKALGQTILLDDGNAYRVSAVYKDFPENTHIRPGFIFPEAASNRDNVAHDAGWWSIGYLTYVQLQDGVTPAELDAVTPEFVDRYLEPRAPGRKMSQSYGYKAIALKDVHFETAARDAGDPLLLTGFAAIAFIILSIATFNFMNMSISRTVVRAREVAVRKVFGASQKNIINLFLNETLLTVLLAMFFAVVITEISLLWFNDFVSKIMSLGTLLSPTFMAGTVGLILLVALGAGLYPAKVLANFRPATVLRGGRSASKNMSRLAAVLVTAQFAVAIGLMIGATIIYQQIKFSQEMDPGYQKENLLLVQGLAHPRVNRSAPLLKDRIKGLDGVTQVSLVDQAPGGTYGWMEGIQDVDGVRLDEAVTIRGMYVDESFLSAFGMHMVAGRELNAARAEDISRPLGQEEYRDKTNILVNQQTLKTLGLGTPEQAIGKTMGPNGSFTIVGVLADYLIGSSKGTVPPMMFQIDQQGYRLLAIRYKTNDVAGLLASIDATWAEVVQDRPIRRQFMDDRIASLYRIEQQQGQLFALFAGLSVLVSCIGLYGLASFSVARRTKEIGLRKVLGASTAAVTRRILWDFSKPVLVANIIAWPAAAYLMRDWLTGFTYAIELGPMPFMAAALAALVVASITVGGHAIRVASANPVHALRYE